MRECRVSSLFDRRMLVKMLAAAIIVWGLVASGCGSLPFKVEITRADGTVTSVSLEEMDKLPSHSVFSDGKWEEGPLLSEVLLYAGVKEYLQITISGVSRFDDKTPASVTLTREQVDENTIFDFTNRGTVKLATLQIPKDDWVHDVATIKVEE